MHRAVQELKRCLTLLATLAPVAEPQKAEPAPKADAPKAKAAPASPTAPGTAHIKAQQQADEEAAPPLHRHAKAGLPDKVLECLEAGADPSERDASGRTAYQVAADKPTRDALRRYMAAHPGAWDYAAAQIPSALTDEMADEQESKKAAKKAKQRERERARKAAAQEKRSAAGVSAADAAEDEVARAALEAQALAAKYARLYQGWLCAGFALVCAGYALVLRWFSLVLRWFCAGLWMCMGGLGAWRAEHAAFSPFC